jgi:hypothetical protein
MEDGGREAMLHDLLHEDISNFDLRKFPRGEALFDQIVQSMPAVRKFWYEQLRDGRISSKNNKLIPDIGIGWPAMCSTAALHELYLDFASAIGDRYKLTDKIFGKHIKQLCPGIIRKKFNSSWHYFFPALLECRQQFEKLVNMKVDWGSEDNEAEDE